MHKKNHSIKWFALLGLVLFLGVAVAPNVVLASDDEHLVFTAFIIGKIKNPYYQQGYYFEVVDVTVIGLFWYDLGVLTFDKINLNEDWSVIDAQYLGINHFRIINNLTDIQYICGIIANADLYSVN